jgi:signal transduction histidine kinase
MARALISLRGSIAVRLAAGYGLLLALSIAAVSAIFYVGTIGVLQRSIDARITSVADRLLARYHAGGQPALLREMAAQLSDRIDSDTEILLVLSAQGTPLAGNLQTWPKVMPVPGLLADRALERDGIPLSARLTARRLDHGGLLVVGRDLRELGAIREVILRALAVSSALSLLFAFFGALVFRHQVESRIGKIRRTASQIAAGDLSRRIPVLGDDEFARLSADINRMLDRIEELMEGVRHVSNSIAHDLRTPLGRLRVRLEDALHRASGREGQLAEGARMAIEDIDGVISVFDKLLHIAAVEAGMRRTPFHLLDLGAIAADIVELYEAAAEEQGATLTLLGAGPCQASGDRDLLASALASLIDNALKYGGAGVRVTVGVAREGNAIALVVRDSGPGVPAAELGRVCERFYRVDRSRHLPGNGLGLSIVSAIAQMHGGRLRLNNADPGLEVRLLLPPPAAQVTAN